MIKTLLTVLVFLVISASSMAQFYKQSQLDSLEKSAAHQEGTERIQTLLTLGEAYLRFHADTAQGFIDLARVASYQHDFEWGLHKSDVIEASIQHHKGKMGLKEALAIKAQRADWFEQHHFPEDALHARLSRNNDLHYHIGAKAASRNASELLRQANALHHTRMIAWAWKQIVQLKNPLFKSPEDANHRDSALFYLVQSRDSHRIITTEYSDLFNASAGHISDSAMQRLLQTAARWQNPALLHFAAKIQGYPFAVQGNIDSIRFYVNKLQQLDDHMGRPTLDLFPTHMLALAYEQSQDYASAAAAWRAAIPQVEKNDNHHDHASATSRLAQCYMRLKAYDLAITELIKSLALCEKIDDQTTANSIKRRLAHLYVLTGAHDEAEQLCRQVLSWGAKYNEVYVVQMLMGNTLHELGNVYQSQQQYARALTEYQAAVEMLAAMGSRVLNPAIGLMSTYVDMNNLEKADSVYQAITVPETHHAVRSIEYFHLQEGRLFLAQKRFQNAINSFREFLNFGMSNEVNEEKKQANHLLYQAYKATGQIDSALAAFEAYNAIDDSLQVGQMTENVQKIQAEYELSIKESEIERLRQQRELSDLRLRQQENELALRALYITLLITLFLVVGAFGYLFLKRLRFKKEEEKKEMRKRMEFAHLKAQQKAELAEVKNTLYANISHEFKTPLTLIRVPLQNYRKTASGKDKVVLDSVIKNTDYLLEMLDELLGVSRLESAKVAFRPACFDLAALLVQIRLNFAPLFAEKDIAFHWEIDLREGGFYGDEIKLTIVVNNLLKNAFDNTPRHGWVTCEVQLDETLLIKVSNQGNPIPTEDLPHLFERFYRGQKSGYAGSGIGLAWSKQIAELHGGTIELDPAEPGQVAFTVCLPQVVPHAAARPSAHLDTFHSTALIDKAERERQESRSTEALPHVLIVEDNADMREVLAATLSSDFRLDFAEDGCEGEKLCLQLQPDLVLSDVMMPKKDGFELLQAIKENFNSSHIPVVLLTARGDSTSRITGLNQDADDYIAKPFDPDELNARLQNILRNRQHLHQLFSKNPLLYCQEAKCTPLDADFIQRAQDILACHYANGEFSVRDFCSELALNKTSVNLKLKALTGHSTAQYIKNFRLEKARIALIETHASVTEIGTDVGFNSLQVFNKAFRQKFQCTPSEFRLNMREAVSVTLGE